MELIWFGAKIVVLIALLVYIVFAFVIVKQISLMTKSLEIGFETPIRIFGFIHLLFSLLVFGLAIYIL